MPIYSCELMDDRGRITSENIDADSERTAREIVTTRGLYLMSLGHEAPFGDDTVDNGLEPEPVPSYLSAAPMHAAVQLLLMVISVAVGISVLSLFL